MAFGTGIYRMETGDLVGAMDSFEAVHGSNPNFSQRNGLGVGELLSYAYYSAAIEQLKAGGETAAETAVGFFDQALDYGDSDASDAHHGKAIAYFVTGDQEAARGEADFIQSNDPEYYERAKEALGGE